MTLVLLRLVLALGAGGSLASRRLVLRAADVGVRRIRRVASVGVYDVAIRRLIVVVYVLLQLVVLRHATDNLAAGAVHEIHHLLGHLATHGLLLLCAPATLRRGIQLLLAVLVTACASLWIGLLYLLVHLRPLEQLWLVLAVRHYVVIGLLLDELRWTLLLLLMRWSAHILRHVVVEVLRVAIVAVRVLLLRHLLQLLVRPVLETLIVVCMLWLRWRMAFDLGVMLLLHLHLLVVLLIIVLIIVILRILIHYLKMKVLFNL